MRLKVRTQFPSSHYSFCFPLCFLASIFVTTSISRIPVVYSARRIEEPLQSCLEQYLSGNGGGDTSSAAVMPLMSGGGQTSSSSPVVWLECQFPQFSGQSLNAYVTTVVHNALERFYILGTQKRTVEYQ